MTTQQLPWDLIVADQYTGQIYYSWSDVNPDDLPTNGDEVDVAELGGTCVIVDVSRDYQMRRHKVYVRRKIYAEGLSTETEE